jgi:mono/diheme cytochrome c family protein
MGKFIAGIIFTIVVLGGAGLLYAYFGHMPVNADVAPGKLETYVAGHAMDASVERQAPKVNNPVQPTEDNLTRGMLIYSMNCAQCHGAPTRKVTLGDGEYPPAPQFTEDPPDMPDHQTYWIIKHGIRYTAMPAWGKMLGDDDIWKVATFLGNWKKLPPTVKSKFETGQ